MRPDAAALGDWDFARLFDVERTVRVPCVSLSKALRDLGVTRVDWFKTDSQGIDLRLFQSLGEAMCSRVLAVEFEPGIIDAYEGEDKMAAVLTAMDRAEFWLSELKLKGTLRMAPEDAARLAGQETTGLAAALPTAPGWGEMRYLNTFRGTGPFSKRDWLLGWVIACVNEQFGFALDLCRRAHVAFPDPLFRQPGGGDRSHDSPKAPQPTGGRRRPIGRPGCAFLWPLAAQTGAARGEIVTRAKSTMKKRPIDGCVMMDL